MFRNNGLGPIISRGMAAFLLLLILIATPVFAAEEVVQVDDEANQATEQLDEVQESSAEVSQKQSEESNNQNQQTADVVLFSTYDENSDETEKITVKLGYTKKIYYENFHTQRFFAKNGSDKYVAYCIQPTVDGMYKKKTTATPVKDALMKKALYYSYGYPGYPKMKEYLSGVSRKACYKGNDGSYVLCHILLSYIYDDEKSNTDAFKGVGKAGQKVVKNLLKAIKSWPDPPEDASLTLSPSDAKANWDFNTSRQTTDNMKLSGGEGNSIKVNVPEGTTLVKTDSAGETSSYDSGTIEIRTGESFAFSAGEELKGEYKSGTMEGSLPIFKPYTVTFSKKQDMAFGVNDVAKVSFSIKWVDFGSVKLLKSSTDEQSIAGNGYFSLEGAEYGLYDSNSNIQVGTLKTGSDGSAILGKLPYGNYYVKELAAPRGFQIDSDSHEITLNAEQADITVTDKPEVPEITTSISEKESASNDIKASGTITVVDKVTYKGLTPGVEYILKGRLMDKETGQELEGSSIERVFTANASEGSIDMEFQVNSNALEGKKLVAFEKLYYGENLIASHEDIDASEQTLTIGKPEADNPSNDDSPQTGDAGILKVLGLLLGSVGVGSLCAYRVRKRLI